MATSRAHTVYAWICTFAGAITLANAQCVFSQLNALFFCNLYSQCIRVLSDGKFI